MSSLCTAASFEVERSTAHSGRRVRDAQSLAEHFTLHSRVWRFSPFRCEKKNVTDTRPQKALQLRAENTHEPRERLRPPCYSSIDRTPSCTVSNATWRPNRPTRCTSMRFRCNPVYFRSFAAKTLFFLVSRVAIVPFERNIVSRDRPLRNVASKILHPWNVYQQ